jgi:lysyl-tRNA synthetase class 2
MSEQSEHRNQRLRKLSQLREKGIDPFPARVQRSHTVSDALEGFSSDEDAPSIRVEVAGRIMSLRVMGKSTFGHIADGTGRIQVYLRQDVLGEEAYDLLRRNLDIGDFLGVAGELFRTRTGEVTVKAEEADILAKTVRPLPEKWHGLRDVETRYRQRYLDLISSEEVRSIFVTRTRTVSAVRRYLDERGFLEVETPILQPIYGGAAARPFTTHHNALDRTLYLRVADELYLKRLIIGGFDGVYEIGHDFRNEGISTKHNPEFTQVEVYQAYADYHDMMRLIEGVYAYAAQEVLGSVKITYQGNEIDLTPPWKRVTMRQAILDSTGVDIEANPKLESLRERAAELNLQLDPQPTWGRLVDEIFGEYVEPGFIQPTILMDYPLEISPLAKRKPDAPHLVERFEFFIGGLECGNSFSELNDPLDQRERFEAQAQAFASGDEEAHPTDEEFLTALEHGMPPTGGLGWGIDRMVMLFTDQSSIREVILFPQLRSKD